MVEKGQQYTVTTDGYSSEAVAVARIDGLAVFVKGALRGETCRIQIEHVGHRAAWARVEEILVPSPHRVAPACPYYPQCGGCQTCHMDYAEELAFKETKVADALRRIGGLDFPVPPVLGAESTERYRNKAQFPVAAGPKVGFYQERSHAVVDVADCALQSPAAAGLAAALRRWMAEYSVPAYDETTRQGLVRHLLVRSNAAGECLAAVVANAPSLPREKELAAALRAATPGLRGVVLNENQRDTNVILGRTWRTLWGEDTLLDSLRGVTFRLSLPAFYQVNHTQTEVLYGLVERFAALTGRERVLDLYCGVGTIGLTLAQHAKTLLGAEIVPAAIEDAKENARRNGIENAQFLCADAAQVAASLARQGEKIDVAIVDPPRKGLAPQVVESLLTIAPERLVYVSCDPATLARDLHLLSQSYRLTHLQCVDMFPRTYHVETVVLLSKGEIDSKKVRVEFSLEDMDMSGFQQGATYEQIKEYVLEKHGLKVSSLYISQVKRKCGLEVGENYNKPKSEDAKQPQCPPDKEKAIKEALEHFGMIEGGKV